MQPIVNQGFEKVRLSASLLAHAEHHERDGNLDAADSIRRVVAVYSARDQTKLETEASIRRAVREVSHW
jgi:hypothetical protein